MAEGNPFSSWGWTWSTSQVLSLCTKYISCFNLLNHQHFLASTCFSSVQLLSHVQLCDPMDCSKRSLPVHHQLPEFTQTHIHWVSDAIQSSHPLPPPSPLAFNLSQIFSNELSLASGDQSFSFRISPSSEYSELISFNICCLNHPVNDIFIREVQTS